MRVIAPPSKPIEKISGIPVERLSDAESEAILRILCSQRDMFWIPEKFKRISTLRQKMVKPKYHDDIVQNYDAVISRNNDFVEFFQDVKNQYYEIVKIIYRLSTWVSEWKNYDDIRQELKILTSGVHIDIAENILWGLEAFFNKKAIVDAEFWLASITTWCISMWWDSEDEKILFWNAAIYLLNKVGIYNIDPKFLKWGITVTCKFGNILFFFNSENDYYLARWENLTKDTRKSWGCYYPSNSLTKWLEWSIIFVNCSYDSKEKEDIVLHELRHSINRFLFPDTPGTVEFRVKDEIVAFLIDGTSEYQIEKFLTQENGLYNYYESMKKSDEISYTKKWKAHIVFVQQAIKSAISISKVFQNDKVYIEILSLIPIVEWWKWARRWEKKKMQGLSESQIKQEIRKSLRYWRF